VSVVHTLPSSQFGGGPPTHAPPEQASFVVQASPSLHGRVLFVFTQPVAGSHVSVVHRLLSLQLTELPVQTPFRHPSDVPGSPLADVQASWSLHTAPLGTLVWVQPVAGVHESFVHTLPSSQFGGGPPTHALLAQVSLVVQAFPSSHEALLAV
jgi:hypothetical protein